MSTLPKTYVTPEQYLEAERKAQTKSQYFNGEVFAMAGASEPHNMVTSNVVGELRNQLRRRCRVYVADMRVLVSTTGLYTYPDVSVTCEKPKLADSSADTLLNPRLIVEVLSPSTEAYDRGEKFEHYRTIETFAQYLLVSTKRPVLELFTRGENGLWVMSDARGLESSIPLSSVGATLALADVYEFVEFAPTTSALEA